MIQSLKEQRKANKKIAALTKKVPRGHWFCINTDVRPFVLAAHGANPVAAVKTARKKGVRVPLLIRRPLKKFEIPQFFPAAV